MKESVWTCTKCEASIFNGVGFILICPERKLLPFCSTKCLHAWTDKERKEEKVPKKKLLKEEKRVQKKR